MSVLGAGGLPAMSLAGSAAAGQQRAVGQVDRDKADQAARKLVADEVRLGNRDLDDNIESDFSHGQVSDRDADGRLPRGAPGDAGNGDEPKDHGTEDLESPAAHHRAHDTEND